MTGQPSQFCRRLIQQLCPKHPDLVDCCVEPVISGMWREQLPSVVKAAVANHELCDGNLADTLKLADNVWASQQVQGAVAAVGPAEAEEVAAFRRPQQQQQQRTGGQSQQGRRQSQPQQSGAARKPRKVKGPHPDGPPPGSCSVHYEFGRSAYFCKAPHSCPWANFTIIPPAKNSSN